MEYLPFGGNVTLRSVWLPEGSWYIGDTFRIVEGYLSTSIGVNNIQAYPTTSTESTQSRLYSKKGWTTINLTTILIILPLYLIRRHWFRFREYYMSIYLSTWTKSIIANPPLHMNHRVTEVHIFQLQMSSDIRIGQRCDWHHQLPLGISWRWEVMRGWVSG